MISTKLKVKLHKTFKQLAPACDLKVIFEVSSRMKNYFNFKGKIKRELRYLLVYNFKCNNCNAEYIVKPNGIIEHESRNILVSHPSQGNVLKITLKLQPTCLFVRQLFVLKIFQFLLKVHTISNLRFKKVF